MYDVLKTLTNPHLPLIFLQHCSPGDWTSLWRSKPDSMYKKWMPLSTKHSIKLITSYRFWPTFEGIMYVKKSDCQHTVLQNFMFDCPRFAHLITYLVYLYNCKESTRQSYPCKVPKMWLFKLSLWLMHLFHHYTYPYNVTLGKNLYDRAR